MATAHSTQLTLLFVTMQHFVSVMDFRLLQELQRPRPNKRAVRGRSHRQLASPGDTEREIATCSRRQAQWITSLRNALVVGDGAIGRTLQIGSTPWMTG